MKGAKALLASWLLVCAAAIANADVTATLSGADPLSLATAVADGNLALSGAARKLSAAAVAGNHEIEELVVRRLSAMVGEASAADSDELIQAQTLFNLYRKVDPELAATWGSTPTAQFDVFYKKVFPKILAKAKAKRAAAKASATVVSTVKNADGSTTVTKSDGSVTVTKADGSSVTTEKDGTITTTKADGTTTTTKATTVSTVKNADGSTTVTKSDGSVTVTKADGSSVTTTKDGTVIATKADGTVTTTVATAVSTVKNADGSTTVTKSDGSTTVTKADGTSVTTTKDGTVITTKTDGTVTATVAATVSTVKNADGSTTVTKSDGSTTVTKADGSSVTTTKDGTVVTTKADGTTTATTPTVVNTTKNADGSTTVTKSDGSTTITKADGTSVTTKQDGTTTTIKADGTTVITTKDGSTSTIQADGSSVSTKTDGTTVVTKTDGTATTTTSDGTTVTTGTDGSTTTKKADGSTTVVKSDGTTTVTKADGTTTTTPGTSPSTGTGTTPSTGTGTTPSTGTGTTPSTGTGSSTLTVKSESDSYEVADSLAFLSQIYDEKLAQNVRVLRDNTKNIETIVQSSKGGDSADAANQYQAPTVLESADEPTTLGRRLANSTTPKTVDVLFCDIGGNAIWKWSASQETNDAPSSTTTITTGGYTQDNELCTAKEVIVKVTAYQSGCSRQNHPEGCDKVYYKGCGGLTVSPGSSQIVVARTGGRSLGVLSYKDIGTTCQGRVVDAIRTYRGKKFNSPSYAEYSKKGHLYFSDSPFGLATKASDLEGDILDKSPLREIPFNGVYLLRNGENGSEPVTLVDCFMDRPNKIAFSPNQDIMYVTNSRKGNSYVKQFALKDDGTAANSSVLFNFTSFPELETDEGYADGIKVDEEGNIYVAVHKGVYVLSPQGVLIGVLKSTQQLSALAFGGGRMFVTGAFGVVAQTSGVLPSVAPARAKTTCD